MSGPSIPLTNMGNGYTIVTHVIAPQPNSSGTQETVSSVGPLHKILRGEPKALGTVQIMIGVFMFLFGIVIINYGQYTITLYSGICFWGSLLFIVTGSLAVKASNKLNRCVVKGALTMNVLSTITAAIAIILLTMDLVMMQPRCSYHYHDCRYYYGSSSGGITGVLLVFSILQFIISIVIAAFSCRATCNSEPTVNITVAPNQEAFGGPALNPFPTQNTQQWMYGAGGATASCPPPMDNPPEYSETKCTIDN